MEAQYLSALQIMLEGKTVSFTADGVKWFQENDISINGAYYINSIETEILRIWSENESEIYDMSYSDVDLSYNPVIEAISEAESFISGFEEEEGENSVKDLLDQLRNFLVVKEFVPAEMLAGDFDGFTVSSITSLIRGDLANNLEKYGEHLLNENRCNSYLIATEAKPIEITFSDEEIKKIFLSMHSKYFIVK